MSFIIAIVVTVFIFSILIAWVQEKWKGTVALIAVLINIVLSSWMGIQALYGSLFDERFFGGNVFGQVFIRIDPLSGWFILIMNFTVLTGILYGRCYMKAYQNQTAIISMHYISYVLIHFAMIGIFCVQHALAFLCLWELMALTAFLLVIFEHEKTDTIKAGINYLIHSHISITFLTLAFIWIKSRTGSYDFNAIAQYTADVHPALSFLLFICFFIGFGIKAGFVPFHTWLPYAHPAAPSHISAVMSGVIIKLGIYGILRILLLIKVNYMLMGYTILVISVISGVYGVMLAIIQHNLKKLLAYHSIENIGIIGIGIGLGCLGLGMKNPYLAFTGFAGALLHTLNHSLFKSLLFYVAGTVYQSTHTLNIERLGGLVKKMPHSAALFLIASLAICGLPPFNGFISEFFIYLGLFNGIVSTSVSTIFVLVWALFGLVIIGGLAMLCFTKAFGIIFLGKAREAYPAPVYEANFSRLFPQYLVVLVITLIGVLPWFFIQMMLPVLTIFTGFETTETFSEPFIDTMQQVSWVTLVFIALFIILYTIRTRVTAHKITVATTWSCGYPLVTSRQQYTANSFVRSYRKLIRPLLMMNKSEGEITEVFPKAVHSDTHPYDKFEAIFVDRPIKLLRRFFGLFNFLQNGSEQFYILYGVGFIIIIITVPALADAVIYLINLFKQV